MQQVSCIYGDDTTVWSAGCTDSFLCDNSSLASVFPSLSSVCVFLMFCYCLKWKPLLETFSLTCKVFFHVEVACPKMFCELMMCRIDGVLSIFMI